MAIRNTNNKEIKDWYISNFNSFENSLNGQSNSSFHKIRRQATETFNEMDFPTLKNEEWKYTNIAPILNYNFVPSNASEHSGLDKIDKSLLKLIKNLNASLAVFVNGYYSEKLSSLKPQANGIRIESLASLIQTNPEFLTNYFAKYAKIENSFTALNTAFVNDGAFIHIPKGCVVEEPIFLLFLSGSDKGLLINQPRNIIVAEENSEAKIIEYYSGISENIYFTNVVDEIAIGENSVIDLYKVQNENLNSFHISKTQAELKANSNFTSNLISFGGALVRNDLNSILNGEGCECNYNGLFIVNGGQQIDNHTLMDHVKPHCQSNELYKGILGGKSRGVFNGKVMVRKDAQKTNAYQSNKNIILSNEALMNTKPQLEIFADDVKCSHGATVGQLDDESVFYLRSRGIDEKTSRSMLISAFAADVIDLIKLEALREKMNEVIFERLHEIEHN